MPTPVTFSTARTEIAGIPVAKLARWFGTPSYIYDAAVILARVDDLKSFDCLRYAQKACSNLAILDLLRRRGVAVDAVSAAEIRRALAAGYSPQGSPPPIVYTADIFDAESLDLVTEHKIHVNCGSPDMIEQLGQRVQGRQITLRLNPGFGHGHSQKTNTGGDHSKHGIWSEQLAECVARADKVGLDVSGLHMHIGSGADLEHLSRVCQAMERAALSVGERIESISAGGGLSIPYREGDVRIDCEAYYRLWDETRRRLEAEFQHAVRLEIEPGRYIVAESGFLVAEIRAVKRQAENTFYLIDAGFNNLARPILYGAYHPIAIAPLDGDLDRPQQDVIVGGPLCESGDIFTQREGGFVCTRRLPEAKVGDLLVIECAGAYGSVMGSNYNSKPQAAEVLIQDKSPRLIRRRQTFEDMIACELNPDESNPS